MSCNVMMCMHTAYSYSVRAAALSLVRSTCYMTITMTMCIIDIHVHVRSLQLGSAKQGVKVQIATGENNADISHAGTAQFLQH